MDDLVVATSAGSETEATVGDMQGLQQSSADEIVKLFERIKTRQVNVSVTGLGQGQLNSADDGIVPSALTQPDNAFTQQYDPDYKPHVSVNKKYVYSINDLISISQQLPAGHAEGKANYLPKKKFWRLNHKQPDHGNQGKSMGHRASVKGLNGSGNGKGLSGDESNAFEKKGNKGKYARAPNSKKGNKFGKHDRSGYMEEKDLAVNNDDLQALEEEFEPTGNSMADFESWKAKMKEMERRKKGLSPSEPTGGSRSSLSKTSSSISDFLGLNRINSDGITTVGALDSQDTHKKSPDNEIFSHKESQLESAKGSYSRFSSFFAQSSSSTSLPTERNSNMDSDSLTKQGYSTATESIPASHNPHVPGGSRLIPFFKNDANATKESKHQGTLNSQDVRRDPVDPPATSPGHPTGPHISHVPQRQDPRTMQPSSLPSQPPMAPDQLQTNNAFFQGLLNKGDLQNNDRNPPGPPPGVMLPPGGRARFPMGQQPPAPTPQVGQPPGIGMSRPFPMGIPAGPNGFPPPPLSSTVRSNGARHGGGPRLVSENGGNALRTNASGGNSNGGPVKSSNLQRAQPPPPSFQAGMVPPQFMPSMVPPGFPMMPPNFNPMYIPPQGGMMPPPAGQGFFPPMPPPSGNMNFNAFPMRPPMPNKQEAKISETKK